MVNYLQFVISLFPVDQPFCDVDTLRACDINTPLHQPQVQPPIRLGTANRNYGNVTLQVYNHVLKRAGFSIETVTDLKHKDMYPLFTEIPRMKDTIDIVVASDLPHKHAQFLEGKHDMFFVAGTSYEAESIAFVMPSASRLKTLGELSEQAHSLSEKIVYTFDYLSCPVCYDFASKWVKDYFPSDFVVKSYSVEELSKIAAVSIY